MTRHGHPSCKAHSKRTGKACRENRVVGLQVCWKHGGANGRAQAAAKRRRAHAEVMQMLGVPHEVDPAEALLQQVHVAAGNELMLRSQVQELGVDITRPTVVGDGVDVRIKLWNDERERLARMSKLALDAGIAERQVRLKEREGAAVAALMVQLIDDPALGLTAQVRALMRQRAAVHLLAMSNAQRVMPDELAGQPLDVEFTALPGAVADRGAHQGDA